MRELKKEYESPELELLWFEQEDVIATSSDSEADSKDDVSDNDDDLNMDIFG